MSRYAVLGKRKDSTYPRALEAREQVREGMSTGPIF